jgi:iron complex outermembrane receptor protein
LYYDHLQRPQQLSDYSIDVGDIEFHHRFALGQRQELIYGGEYRYWADDFGPGPLASMNPQRRDDYIVSGFIQDDFTLVPDRFHLIAGTKIEDNSSSGFEVQPSGRALWTPNERNTVWGAVSRAVRTPSRWEQDATIVSAPVANPAVPLPVQPVVVGTREFDSEELTAYELGYRVKPASAVSVDTSVFYNHYENIRGFEVGTPSFSATPVPHLALPVTVSNSFNAESYGAEIAGTWKVNDRWRLAASYSFLNINVHSKTPPNASNGPVANVYEHASPRNQAQFHSYLDITRNLQFNAGFYFVDSLSAIGVPYYIRTDLGLTWTPKKNLDVTVGVQNLFDNHHPEFAGTETTFTANTEVPRTVYGQIVFRY